MTKCVTGSWTCDYRRKLYLGLVDRDHQLLGKCSQKCRPVSIPKKDKCITLISIYGLPYKAHLYSLWNFDTIYNLQALNFCTIFKTIISMRTTYIILDHGRNIHINIFFINIYFTLNCLQIWGEYNALNASNGLLRPYNSPL